MPAIFVFNYWLIATFLIATGSLHRKKTSRFQFLNILSKIDDLYGEFLKKFDISAPHLKNRYVVKFRTHASDRCCMTFRQKYIFRKIETYISKDDGNKSVHLSMVDGRWSLSARCANRSVRLPKFPPQPFLFFFRTDDMDSLQHVKLWSTCVLFRRSLRMKLTSWAYPAININSCLQALTKDISTPADIALSALETIVFYCFIGYISALTYYLLLLFPRLLLLLLNTSVFTFSFSLLQFLVVVPVR